MALMCIGPDPLQYHRNYLGVTEYLEILRYSEVHSSVHGRISTIFTLLPVEYGKRICSLLLWMRIS